MPDDNPYAKFRQAKERSRELSEEEYIHPPEPTDEIFYRDNEIGSKLRANDASEFLHHFEKGSNLKKLSRFFWITCTLLILSPLPVFAIGFAPEIGGICLLGYCSFIGLMLAILLVQWLIFHHRSISIFYLHPNKPPVSPETLTILSLLPLVNVAIFYWTCFHMSRNWEEICDYYGWHDAPELGQKKFTGKAICHLIPGPGTFAGIILSLMIYSEISKILDYLKIKNSSSQQLAL